MNRKRQPTSPYNAFAKLSAADKEAVYQEVDEPDIARKAKPLTPKLKRLWSRAKKKVGRPRVGRGAKRVLLSIERGLLEEADALARRQKLTRSEVFSRGVRTLLAKAG